MKPRARQHAHLKKDSETETAAAILASHGHAKDKDGNVCSLPMKPEKAARLATAIHGATR